jgi:phosphatidylglycerol:prolipoprotein diacylglycerol transferase
LRWESLGLDPVAVDLGFFKIRWYSLAYITGILVGWWYLGKMCERPGAPMAKRHVDDFVFYATLGIILGGRIGYVLFYQPEMLSQPSSILKLWEGGMSFHGGVLGVIIGILWFARVHKLDWLRIHDYIVVVYPIGHFLGRLANFVNGELWGRETSVAWGMVFPGGGDVVRHPSQLYQAGLEGLALAILMCCSGKPMPGPNPAILRDILFCGWASSGSSTNMSANPISGSMVCSGQLWAKPCRPR